MNNRSYALLLCAALAVLLTAGVDARSIDTGVWRGDHGSFTVEKAYSMFWQSLGRDQTKIVAVAYIAARRTKSERHYYRIGTNFGISRDAKGSEPRLVGFNVWEDGRVEANDEVYSSWKNAVTRESDCGALFAALKRLNVDIKSVDKVSRDAHGKEKVLCWYVSRPKGSFWLYDEEISSLVRAEGTPDDASNGDDYVVNRVKERIESDRSKYELEIFNDQYIGLSNRQVVQKFSSKPEVSEFRDGKIMLFRLELGDCGKGVPVRRLVFRDGPRRVFVWLMRNLDGSWSVIRDLTVPEKVVEWLL